MSTLSISVLMPVYDADRYIRASVASILAQTHRNFELIAVDDGSKDDSAKILATIAAGDPRVCLISRANTGIVGALNDGLTIATGEFIARMDADDHAEPDRFRRQLNYLSAHPDCVALGTGFLKIDQRDARVDLHVPPTDHDDIESRLLTGDGSALAHPTMMVRTSALRAINGYNPAFDKAEDLDLYFRLMRSGRLANIPEPLLRYRVHTDSTNFRHRYLQQNLVSQILDRERTARNLPPSKPGLLQGPSDLPTSARHRQWACTSCKHGSWYTAWRYALQAIIHEPAARETWRTLRYVWSRRNTTPWRETKTTITEVPGP